MFKKLALAIVVAATAFSVQAAPAAGKSLMLSEVNTKVVGNTCILTGFNAHQVRGQVTTVFLNVRQFTSLEVASDPTKYDGRLVVITMVDNRGYVAAVTTDQAGELAHGMSECLTK